MERTILERELSKIMTKYGEITVKKSKLDEMYRDYPEYDSVVKACQEHKESYINVVHEVFGVCNNM